MSLEDKLPKDRNITIFLMVVLIMTCVVLIWSSWQTFQSFNDSKRESEKLMRMSDLHGTILYLDEVLTMSTQMAVATGDLKWEQRYRKFESSLDVAIKEVLALTSDDGAVKAAVKTDAANKILIEMEDHAFDQVREGNINKAKEILFSDKYVKQKQIYMQGMAQFIDAISKNTNTKWLNKQHRALLQALRVALLLSILFIVWFVVVYALNKRRDMLLTSYRNLAQKKKQLVDLNNTLDKRVFERTEELSKTNESLNEKAKSIELMKDIAIAANELNNINESVSICMKMVCNYMGWPIGHYYVAANDGSNKLVTSGIWHLEYPNRFEMFRKVTEETHFEPGIGLPGRVLSSGEPFWIANLMDDINFPRAKLAENIGISSGLAFPIKVNKKIIGVLEFFSDNITEPDLDKLEIMKHIGSQLGQVYERKQAENTLQESNERFRASFTNTTIGLALISLNHSILEANQAFCSMLGYSKDQLVGVFFKDITYQEDVKISLDQHNKLISGEIDSYHLEKRYIHKQGHLIWVMLNVSIVRNKDNIPLYLIAHIQDVTNRKQAESAVKESEKKYRGLLENASDGMVITNAKGVIEIVNQELQKMTGYMSDELVGQKVEILIPERFAHHKKQRDSYITKPIARYMGEGVELFVKRKDGSEFPAEIGLSPLEMIDGLIISISIRNITERKQAEEKLEAAFDNQKKLARRLDDIREEERKSISREIHDDFGNAFTLQSINLNWLRRKLPNQTEEVYNKIDSMISNCKSSIELTRKIASNLRPAVLDDLGLDAAIEWYCGEINKTVYIDYKITDSVPFAIQEDIKTTLYRIFQEAMTNIIRHSKADEAHVELTFSDEVLYMIIRDNGIGIDESKINSNNTFGISGMIERASRQNGKITIKNRDEGGTQLTVSIPLDNNTQNEH
jgi:PAS domain S-box-containing protein